MTDQKYFPFTIGRRWRRASWALLALMLSWAGGDAGADEARRPNYFTRTWRTEDGLPDNAVTAVTQARDGYLWIGTYGGLVRFDGVRFRTFNSANTPGLQSDRVTGLFEDAAGTLWIGHERGDLTRFKQGEFESWAVHEAGVRRKVPALGIDGEGEVWMLNEEGTLLRVRDGLRCSLPNTDGVAVLARDGRGDLYVASGGQLAVLAQGRLQMLSNTNDSNGVGGYIQGICAAQDGGLWVLSDGLVRKWSGQTVTENRGTNPCQATAVVMLETKSGALAMGTSSDGLFLQFSNRTVLHFNQANGFANNWIRCLHEDREGTLWVGTGSAGLTALRLGKVETLDAPDNWQGRVPLSVTTARDGAIWVGSEGAGLYRFLAGRWERFAESAGLSNNYVWCVSEDSQGRMWAGTWGGGMFRQQGKQFVTPPGLENITVPMPAILHASNGVTWIGSASGLLRYEAGATQWFGEKAGLKNPDVRAIVEDRDGTVWFGMVGGGLGRLKNGRVEQFLKSDGLSSDYVQCLHLGTDGSLWVGSDSSGLDRFKNGHLAKITTTEGLPNNTICGIETDTHGNYWISSHNGFFRVSEEALNQCADGKTPAITCLIYGKSDGLPALACSGGLQPASCTLPDGRICFPTSKGLVLVNPNDTKVNLLPPNVVIEAAYAGGRALKLPATSQTAVEIPPGNQRFEFHYTGLSFVAPERMQFQYRLEGWDKEWVEAANNKRVAEYNFLPPGDYLFRVRAANSDGVWNETGATLALTVQPHFWQTLWFRTLTTLAACALVAGGGWFISRRRMRHKLEASQRQQAVERERTRIAKDIHDHLGANLTRISLLSQSAHGDLENPRQAATQLERIYNTSRELTRSMDEIVWAVNPQHDTLDSLASYLGNFAQEYLGSINLRCRLDMPLHLPHWPITAELRHNVFLAFKEALHNVIKHAAAREVLVALETHETGFKITLRDDGQGFDPTSVPPRPGRGNGLKNMEQRLAKLGGRCTLQSAPGQGTEVSFDVHLPAHARQTASDPKHVIN